MYKRLRPVHLGEIQREKFITPLALSANKLALDLRAPLPRISEIVNERGLNFCGNSPATGVLFRYNAQILVE
jgi:hypothetical protein